MSHSFEHRFVPRLFGCFTSIQRTEHILPRTTLLNKQTTVLISGILIISIAFGLFLDCWNSQAGSICLIKLVSKKDPSQKQQTSPRNVRRKYQLTLTTDSYHCYLYNHHYSYYSYQSAAVWRWIGSLHVFRLCAYSFVILKPPLGALCRLFSVLGLTLGSFRVPLGSPWTTLVCLGIPWSSPWSARRHFVYFKQIGHPIPGKWISSTQPAHKKRPRRTHLRQPRLALYPSTVAQDPQLPAPLHSRRGLG